MRGVGVNHHLRKFRDIWNFQERNRTPVSNCLYSVTKYNSSAHIEINLTSDL